MHEFNTPQRNVYSGRSVYSSQFYVINLLNIIVLIGLREYSRLYTSIDIHIGQLLVFRAFGVESFVGEYGDEYNASHPCYAPEEEGGYAAGEKIRPHREYRVVCGKGEE